MKIFFLFCFFSSLHFTEKCALSRSPAKKANGLKPLNQELLKQKVPFLPFDLLMYVNNIHYHHYLGQ